MSALKGPVYIFHYGNKAARNPVPCEKGNADPSDTSLFAWIDPDGNIAGWARLDGTPNEYGSRIETITVMRQIELVERALLHERTRLAVYQSGIAMLRANNVAEKKVLASKIYKGGQDCLESIDEMEAVKLSLWFGTDECEVHKLLGTVYESVRKELNLSREQVTAHAADKQLALTGAGLIQLENGCITDDTPTMYKSAVTAYVDLLAQQAMRNNEN